MSGYEASLHAEHLALDAVYDHARWFLDHAGKYGDNPASSERFLREAINCATAAKQHTAALWAAQIAYATETAQ